MEFPVCGETYNHQLTRNGAEMQAGAAPEPFLKKMLDLDAASWDILKNEVRK
jgi:hypothetical protein